MPTHARFRFPLTFSPIPKARIWGGNRIASVLSRPMPTDRTSIGESWEICDRPNEQSEVNHGPLTGTSLHQLWKKHRKEVFGETSTSHPSHRFPLLFKILDATDTLSVQVHPPEHLCQKLQGEPKTEAWRLLDATPDACVYAGFNQLGLSAEIFRRHLKDQTAASLLHRIPVQTGDTLLIPSGRCHAIGSGCLIAEIQQNSDTTYRLFDWNRTDSNGLPRELHVDEALECIDFGDVAPQLHPPNAPLATSSFHLQSDFVPANARWIAPKDEFALIHILTGALIHENRRFPRGSTILVPATIAGHFVAGETSASVLRITLPRI